MQIKSRGFDKDTKQWYYGAYFKHQLYEICPVQFTDENAADKEPKYEHYIVFDGVADWNMEKPIKTATVDPKSVGIYIGRKDVFSREIYSGDIVKFDKMLGAVVYLEEEAQFAIELADGTIMRGVAFEYVKIVGNTYQNIDLLI